MKIEDYGKGWNDAIDRAIQIVKEFDCLNYNENDLVELLKKEFRDD